MRRSASAVIAGALLALLGPITASANDTAVVVITAKPRPVTGTNQNSASSSGACSPSSLAGSDQFDFMWGVLLEPAPDKPDAGH